MSCHRSRLEDLGRIYMLDDDFWDVFEQCRPKDAFDRFKTLSEDDQEETLRKLLYGRECLKEKLYETLILARGEECCEGCTCRCR